MSAAPAAVDFTVLIPARMASSRLPDKPLADIGGLPMIVRTARAAAMSAAQRVVVACDDERIQAVCQRHGIEAILTAAHHTSGSDRLAEAATALGLDGDAIVVNVQGDEPLIEAALINATAAALAAAPTCAMSTAAHPIATLEDLANPNVVKVVCDAASRALYFSRAPIPFARDHAEQHWWSAQTPDPGQVNGPFLDRFGSFAPLRHVGIYAYRAAFLRSFPSLSPAPLEAIEMLEQLRALWHGHAIAVHISASAPAAGVDTPEDLQRVCAMVKKMQIEGKIPY